MLSDGLNVNITPMPALPLPGKGKKGRPPAKGKGGYFSKKVADLVGVPEEHLLPVTLPNQKGGDANNTYVPSSTDISRHAVAAEIERVGSDPGSIVGDQPLDLTSPIEADFDVSNHKTNNQISMSDNATNRNSKDFKCETRGIRRSYLCDSDSSGNDENNKTSTDSAYIQPKNQRWDAKNIKNVRERKKA